MRLDFRQLGSDERGVQWTLEAVFAVLLLMSALVVVLEAVSFDEPQSEDEVIQSQLEQSAADVYDLAAQEGLLRESILYWNSNAGRYIGTDTTTGSEAHYTNPSSSLPMGTLLQETLEEQQIAYNLIIEYEDGTGGTNTRRLIYQGPPGGQSVTVSQNLILSDSDKPFLSSGDCTLREIDAPGTCPGESYYIPNAHPESLDRYNTLRVQLEVWQI